eukprot:scaffold87462_cov19-Tisochrysis_lutea.AAC.1
MQVHNRFFARQLLAALYSSRPAACPPCPCPLCLHVLNTMSTYAAGAQFKKIEDLERMDVNQMVDIIGVVEQVGKTILVLYCIRPMSAFRGLISDTIVDDTN